jgi:hypothetical protein
VEAVNSDRLHDICLAYPVSGAGNPILVAMTFSDDREGPGRILPSEAQANAAFICRACNAHDALVAALEAVVEEEGKLGIDEGISIATYKQAIAALALARGDPQ